MAIDRFALVEEFNKLRKLPAKKWADDPLPERVERVLPSV